MAACRRGTRSRSSQFPEALQFAIEEQRREIAAIADNPDAPTFDNTIVALEKSGQRLNRVGTIYGLYSNNLSSPEFQAVREEWDPKLSAASDEVTLNPKLFQRIKGVYDARQGLGLDAKQLRLVEKTYEGFVRNGANLEPAQKEQLATINQQLASAFGSFSDKVLADEGKYTVAAGGRAEGHSAGHPERRQVGREGARPSGRAVCDRQHPLFGRPGADLRRQPRLARESVAGVRQSRRQW